MGWFYEHIQFDNLVFDDYTWHSCKDIFPLNYGDCIGLFKSDDPNGGFYPCDIEYTENGFKWGWETSKPCEPIQWIGIPDIDACICNDYGSGIIIAKPWKSRRYEPPTEDFNGFYLVFAKYDETYIVTPRVYYADKGLFEKEDKEEEIYAYLKLPTPKRLIK